VGAGPPAGAADGEPRPRAAALGAATTSLLMATPPAFDARAAFGHLVHALDAQATVLQSVDTKQDQQAERLVSIAGHLIALDGRAAAETHLDSIDGQQVPRGRAPWRFRGNRVRAGDLQPGDDPPTY
jgi:hypothetical protein